MCIHFYEVRVFLCPKISCERRRPKGVAFIIHLKTGNVWCVKV